MLKNNLMLLLLNLLVLMLESKLDKLKETWNMPPGLDLMPNTNLESPLVKMLSTS